MIGKIGSTIASRSSFAQVTHETHHKNQEETELKRASELVEDEFYLEAFVIFQRWAVKNNRQAQFEFGKLYYHGHYVDEDNREAFSWFKLAADADHEKACFQVGSFYEIGIYVQQDFKQAMHYYAIAANQGNAAACFKIGFMYHHGLGIPQDRDTALGWYITANKFEDEIASEQIEEMQQNQEYTGSNTYENLFSERPAPSCPDAWVADWLSRQSVGSIKKTIIESIINTVKECGSTSACTEIGQLYLSGDVFPKTNHEEAWTWFLRAANRGDATACLNLGMLCYMSKSFEPNLQTAIYWYKEAHQLGLSIANMEIHQLTQELLRLAFIDLENKDYASAHDKFAFLVSENDADAQYRLNLMHEHEFI